MTADATSIVGLAHAARHRGDLPAARDLYLQALALSPGNLSIRLDVAAASVACNDLQQAWGALSPVKLHDVPKDLAWRFHLCAATVLHRLGRPEAAVAQYRSALGSAGLPPSSRQSALQSATDLLLNTLGDPGAAAQLHGTGLAPEDATADQVPEALQADPQAWLALLISALYTGAVESRRLVKGFCSFAGVHLMPKPHEGSPIEWAAARRADTAGAGRAGIARPLRRPRIGLVSPLLCASPVGFLTLGSVEALAQQADLVVFDRGGKADWAQTRFRAAAAAWVSCRAADASQLRTLFVEAQLDAIVDLGGWMDLEVLKALAFRPVPRQFKWVGGQSLTTGLSCFDAFWADARQVRKRDGPLYAEPVARFSEGYVTYCSPPYRDLSAAAAHPPVPKPASSGAYALVSNPAKIGPRIRARLDVLKPDKLFLVDARWRHAHARKTVQQWLGPWVAKAEFITPAHHVEYLDALAQLDATVIDTEPYSMGLTAIELRLLGKPIVANARAAASTMSERHCAAHLSARRFDHHARQAQEILAWCRA